MSADGNGNGSFAYAEPAVAKGNRSEHAALARSLPAAPDEHPRVGVRFHPLDKDLPTRQKAVRLAKIVGELQRAEARRVRRTKV